MPETRNSCAIIETGYKGDRLVEVTKKTLPPVSTAVAQRRARKLSTNDSLGLTSKRDTKNGNADTTNITESQKRIRAILDKD